ncbi:hypothetical protein GF385_02965 [Candidatus Dependentiae bacterium]|nr:hypothetical protein [Candidatus Dependentiae bacterium]
METKNWLTLIICSAITFFHFSSVVCNTEESISYNPEIEEYFNKTPSQISSVSIRYYLINQDQTYKNFNTVNEQLSKTNIFKGALSKYIKEIYNNKYYSNFLSQNGSHIVEFLELSDELNLDINPLYTCLRLFYNKIKSCELIDDTVILQILNPLPIFVEKYFVEKQNEEYNLKFLKKSIEKTIVSKFTDHISEFQEEPNIFISKLSNDISKIAKKELFRVKEEKEEKEMQTRLRNLIIRFLEIILSKAIWDMQSYQGIWESVLSIANNIIRLADYKILDHMDDLDDLLWSLTHRFCYFLNLAGSYLPIEFFEEIENDIANETAFFLEIEEQDDHIKTKKEVILDALIKAKVKAIAFYERGIVSDQII